MRSCGECRQAVEVLIRDVLPNVLDLIPEDLEAGFKLHIAAGAGRVPDSLAALLQQNKEVVTVHGHLTEEQVLYLYL